MKQITPLFDVFDSDIDEDEFRSLPPIEACKAISYHKALVAKEKFMDDTIVSADTIVVLDKKIINKPKNKRDAYYILKKLSNKTHEVITAFTIMKGDLDVTDIVISKVVFNKLSDELINDYIASGSPLDKAGAYGIQDNEKFPIVKSYEGSYDNIVGFPVKEIKETLESM